MAKTQWKSVLTTGALSFLFWVWTGVKVVIDSLGRVLVYQDFSKPDGLVAHGLVWLFKTPWWVPGAIAVLLAAGLIFFLFRDSGKDETGIVVHRPTVGSPLEQYAAEKLTRLEEEARLRAVEYREEREQREALSTELQSLQRKHKLGQNAQERIWDLFNESTERSNNTSAKWQLASETITAVDEVLSDFQPVSAKGLLGSDYFEQQMLSPDEKVEKARDIIWDFYQKRAAVSPSSPGLTLESALDRLTQRVVSFRLPGIQPASPLPSASRPAVIAPTIPPLNPDAPCPCGSEKTYGTCHGQK